MRSKASITGRLLVAVAMAGLGLGLGPGCADDLPVAPGGTQGATSTGGSSSDGLDDTVTCDVVDPCDGLDNDCDGEVDEGCACIDGDLQPCFDDDAALIGMGACVEGEQACDLEGNWGECLGQVLPTDESCNGIDDDCDGEVDDGFSTITCGMGICQVTVDECVDGAEQICEPGTPEEELCDRLDNDCDGEVDEDCDCIEGEVQPCYTGARGTQGVGECVDGSQTCDLQGQWGACEGDVTPVAELCNGLDDDCDGSVDQDDPEGGTACDTGLQGTCAGGTEHCLAGALECTQDVAAAPEICDGLDNDCDGAVDDGDPGGGSACSTGQAGICAAGTEQCLGGVIECTPTLMPVPEVCNLLDDDCNGVVDDGNPGGGLGCVTGLPGECSMGTTSCLAGMVDCVPDTPASPEICDDLDNDCDGLIDDGDPGGGVGCATGLQGVCAAGTTSCQGGSVACVPDLMPSPEVCDDLDNDCDGVVDEGNPGGGGACATGQPGVCAAGTTTCQAGAFVCAPNVPPSPEICDGLDNDCDGLVDNGNPGGGTACVTGQPGVCSAGTTACQAGVLVCQPNVLASPEVCDGLDNDCDGVVDDGNPEGGVACMTGQPGVCSDGTTACVGGALLCSPDTPASPELCDGLDNDCDGVVDDGNPGGGSGCGTGLLGVCANGQITCTGGALGCTQTVFPSPEVCGDGLDNDCNGAVDDGCPACPPGYTSCDLDPDCETNTLDDGSNCGGCGILCADDEFCDNGSCTPCAGTMRDCDDDGATACEVDISSDAINCGGCGTVCGTPAGGLCCSSVCTDGDVNNCGACGEPCYDGMLVINELMNNPAVVGDAAGEWFELYNPNPFDIDVRGFVLSDLGTDSHMVVSVTPVIVPAFGVAVLGNNDDPLANGGAPVSYQYTGIFLANGADELIVTAYGQELDRVEWNASFPVNGSSRELSLNHQDTVSNDVLANWCVAVTPFGDGDLGTPGLTNDCAL